MIFTALLYATITALAMLLVGVAYGRERARFEGVPTATGILLGSYLASNACVLVLGAAMGVKMFPPLDAVCLVLVFFQWRLNRQPWSLALSILFGLEVVRHAFYLYMAPNDEIALRGYLLYLNVCYVAQLCSVALPSLIKLMGEHRSGRTAS